MRLNNPLRGFMAMLHEIQAGAVLTELRCIRSEIPTLVTPMDSKSTLSSSDRDINMHGDSYSQIPTALCIV